METKANHVLQASRMGERSREEDLGGGLKVGIAYYLAPTSLISFRLIKRQGILKTSS